MTSIAAPRPRRPSAALHRSSPPSPHLLYHFSNTKSDVADKQRSSIGLVIRGEDHHWNATALDHPTASIAIVKMSFINFINFNQDASCLSVGELRYSASSKVPLILITWK